MPKYSVNRESFDHDQKRYTLGDTVEMTEEQAAQHLGREALLELPADFTPAESSVDVVAVEELSVPAAEADDVKPPAADASAAPAKAPRAPKPPKAAK